MSGNIQLFLIVFYSVIAATSCYEKQYNKALYWLGALLLTVSVYRMK